MIYLNEPEDGGATRFKLISKSVQPETGKLLAWNNLLPDGSPNSSPSTRFVARSCTNCHNAIHGSNAPSNRGRFFIR